MASRVVTKIREAATARARTNRPVDQYWLNTDLKEDYKDAIANGETALPFEDWILKESFLADPKAVEPR